MRYSEPSDIFQHDLLGTRGPGDRRSEGMKLIITDTHSQLHVHYYCGQTNKQEQAKIAVGTGYMYFMKYSS